MDLRGRVDVRIGVVVGLHLLVGDGRRGLILAHHALHHEPLAEVFDLALDLGVAFVPRLASLVEEQVVHDQVVDELPLPLGHGEVRPGGRWEALELTHDLAAGQLVIAVGGDHLPRVFRGCRSGDPCRSRSLFFLSLLTGQQGRERREEYEAHAGPTRKAMWAGSHRRGPISQPPDTVNFQRRRRRCLDPAPRAIVRSDRGSAWHISCCPRGTPCGSRSSTTIGTDGEWRTFCHSSRRSWPSATSSTSVWSPPASTGSRARWVSTCARRRRSTTSRPPKSPAPRRQYTPSSTRSARWRGTWPTSSA